MHAVEEWKDMRANLLDNICRTFGIVEQPPLVFAIDELTQAHANDTIQSLNDRRHLPVPTCAVDFR
jgi:hypothetical protein